MLEGLDELDAGLALLDNDRVFVELWVEDNVLYEFVTEVVDRLAQEAAVDRLRDRVDDFLADDCVVAVDEVDEEVNIGSR